ncbi:MAG: M23 family metallopeptidase [bacterium]|nr:M23 family metallopeptidase [bacterium]
MSGRIVISACVLLAFVSAHADVPGDASVLKGYIDPVDGRLVLPDNEQGRMLTTAEAFRGISFAFPVAGRTFHAIEYSENTGLTDYRNRWRRNHYGTDIFAPGGTPVLAAADGVVTVSTFTPSPGPGWKVAISHGNGVYTYYLHMSEVYVSVGDEVMAGDSIAGVGAKGNAAGTPTHLHFEIDFGVETQGKPDWFVEYVNFKPGIASLRSVEPLAYLCKHDTLLRDFRGVIAAGL